MGSDFPFVVNECGYVKASQIVNEIEDLTGGTRSDSWWLVREDVSE